MKTDKHARSPVSPEMQCMMRLVTRKKCKIFETDGCPLFLVSKRGDSRVCWSCRQTGKGQKTAKQFAKMKEKSRTEKGGARTRLVSRLYASFVLRSRPSPFSFSKPGARRSPSVWCRLVTTMQSFCRPSKPPSSPPQCYPIPLFVR